MSKIIKLHNALINLQKKIEGFQDGSKSHQEAIAQVSQDIHESLDVLLKKAQCISAMAYRDDFRNKSLEKVSIDMVKEITKLTLLNEELQALSGNKVVWNQRLKL